MAEIRKSIRRHGQYRAIVVRSHDGGYVILAGNHTADALEAEGHELARCEVIECSDDEARRIALADNRMAELGSYDDAGLAELLSSLDGDYDGTGWTADDLEGLLGGDSSGDGGGDAPEDELPVMWGIVVECGTEAEQAQLLARLDEQGYRVRALMT